VCHSGTSTHAPKYQDRMNMTAMVKRPRPTASAIRAMPFVRAARSCNEQDASLTLQARQRIHAGALEVVRDPQCTL